MTGTFAQTSFLGERSADFFAGGGGASTGFELATGRPLDYAVNHDADAILMHKANHPYTEHFQEDVFAIEPQALAKGQPMGFMWFSPDCKHFSKAKGEPLVDRKIRGLSWVIIKWALYAPPRVWMMENVEEIQTWGPLIPMKDPETGRLIKIVTNHRGRKCKVVAEPGEVVPANQMAMVPDPARKGETFRAFLGMLTTGIKADHPALPEVCEFLHIDPAGEDARRLISGLGYHVEFRELVAADFGAPTSRKRFVAVGRRDGRPIVWPERTHAPADSREVRSGKCLPWRSAAEVIDFSIPCPSIFEDKATIRAKYGVDAVRPLADNTQRRAICGVDKFTIKSGKPFIIPVGYGERVGQAPRVHDLERPLSTVVSTGKQYLCEPVFSPFGIECNHSGDGHVHNLEDPHHTITAKHTGGVCEAVLAPVTFSNTGGSVGAPASQPVHTIRSAGGQVITTALLAQYHTEQTETARVNSLKDALPTVDASNRYAVVTAHLTEYYGNGQPLDVRDPLRTVTGHDREALTAAILQPFHAGGYHGRGNSPEKPVNTITSSGGQSLVTVQIAEFKGRDLGQNADRPLRTITASAGQFAVTEVRTVRYAPGEDLGYWPEIRALLNKYCGYQLAENEILLLQMNGGWYFIRDIGLRMLTPRELYNAMGFPPDYIIDLMDPRTGKPYSKAAKVARCGNAVCPPLAEAMVRANLPEWCGEKIRTMAELERRVAV